MCLCEWEDELLVANSKPSRWPSAAAQQRGSAQRSAARSAQRATCASSVAAFAALPVQQISTVYALRSLLEDLINDNIRSKRALWLDTRPQLQMRVRAHKAKAATPISPLGPTTTSALGSRRSGWPAVAASAAASTLSAAGCGGCGVLCSAPIFSARRVALVARSCDRASPPSAASWWRRPLAIFLVLEIRM